MFKWFRNRHKHLWKAVGVSRYASITGPRTIIQYVCVTGPHMDARNVQGWWTLDQLNEGK